MEERKPSLSAVNHSHGAVFSRLPLRHCRTVACISLRMFSLGAARSGAPPLAQISQGPPPPPGPLPRPARFFLHRNAPSRAQQVHDSSRHAEERADVQEDGPESQGALPFRALVWESSAAGYELSCTCRCPAEASGLFCLSAGSRGRRTRSRGRGKGRRWPGRAGRARWAVRRRTGAGRPGLGGPHRRRNLPSHGGSCSVSAERGRRDQAAPAGAAS